MIIFRIYVGNIQGNNFLFGRIIKTLLFETFLSKNFLGAFSDLLNKNIVCPVKFEFQMNSEMYRMFLLIMTCYYLKFKVN